MGQIRHGNATTTHAVRAAIQRSQSSLAVLRKELGINPKTVAKWRKRATVEDLKTWPREPCSSILTEAEEAIIVAFRRHTGPVPVSFRSFESNTRHQGDRIWQ
jgi:transposase-like protein